MTQQEIEDISKKAEVIVKLDVMAWLKMIEAKALEWKTKLSKG
jgi:hypothetical protein